MPVRRIRQCLGIGKSFRRREHQRTDMHDACLGKHCFRDLRQIIVRRTVTVKAEGAVAALVQLHKGECGITAGIDTDEAVFQSAVMCVIIEEPTDEVVSDAADE